MAEGEVRGRSCRLLRHPFVPERIRAEVSALLDRTVLEERMEKPFEVHWDTLEGGLEIAVAKDDGAILRATDTRRVAYRTGPGGGPVRAWYRTETVTSFSDHGREGLAVPPGAGK